MTESPVREVHFTSPEHEELKSYRPTNLAAIGALLVALISPLALIHPLLLIVPITAVVLAGVALHPSRAEAWGRSFGYAALALALLCAATGASRYFYRQNLLIGQARKHTETWFQLILEGKYQEAHQLSKYHYERVSRGTSLEAHYAKREQDELSPGGMMEEVEDPAAELEFFLNDPPVKRLRETGDFRWRFERMTRTQRMMGEESFDLIYTILPSGTAAGQPFQVAVTIVRSIEYSVGYWRIQDFNEAS